MSVHWSLSTKAKPNGRHGWMQIRKKIISSIAGFIKLDGLSKKQPAFETALYQNVSYRIDILSRFVMISLWKKSNSV